jgi:tripartite-type tricarboxylate transporter receptor subunit TctC
MYVSAASAVQPAAAGQVRFLAVGAGERMALLPDVPTVAEGGVPGYRSVSWFGLFAPAGTPRPVVEKINGEVRRFFADPAVVKNFLDPQLFEPIAGTPEQLSEYLSSEAQKWTFATPISKASDGQLAAASRDCGRITVAPPE